MNCYIFSMQINRIKDMSINLAISISLKILDWQVKMIIYCRSDQTIMWLKRKLAKVIIYSFQVYNFKIYKYGIMSTFYQ